MLEFNLKIDGINLAGISIEPNTGDLANKVLSFDVSGKCAIIPDRKIITVHTSVIITEKGTKVNVGSISTLIGFSLIEFDNYIKLSPKGVYTMPDALQQRLKVVAISTTRGIMFSEFKGTRLQKVFLPLLPETIDNISTIM